MQVVGLVDERGRRWRLEVARSRHERVRGLIGRTLPGPHEGLLIPQARSIHTFGMRGPILVAWLDAEGRILDVRPVKPRRVCLPRRGARHVLECSPDADLRVGEVLSGVLA